MLIYFQSKAGGNFLMLEEHVRILLDLMNKNFTPKGIITSNDIPKNLIILQSALLAHELQAKQLANEEYEQSIAQENIDTNVVINIELTNESLDKNIDKEKNNEFPIITLRQRLWPLINIMNRANLKNTDILWGI